MSFSTSVYRTAACIVVVGALGGLASCAAEPALRIISPTMAPDQTIAEACELSGEEVDQVTVETEQQIKEGLSQAAADLASGQAPSFDFLSESVAGTVADLQQGVTNPELQASLDEVRAALEGFSEIPQPDSALAVPGYLSSLNEQLDALVQAGDALKQLCVVEDPAAADAPAE